MNTTVNQHHVWQHHLRAWANDKDQIHCLHEGNPKVFLTNTRNVASGRFFYEAFELEPADLTYINHVLSQIADPNLRAVNKRWVDMSQLAFSAKKAANKATFPAEVRDALLGEIDVSTKTQGETLHTHIEDRAQPLLDALRQGDSSFYESLHGEDAVTFFTFLSFQYLRTARQKAVVSKVMDGTPMSADRIWPVLASIHSTSMGASLFARQAAYRLVFANNNTGVPFITGDQPIINLLGVDASVIEFYFPLTPQIALLVTARNEEYPHDQFDVTEEQVSAFNRKIYELSYRQIFGNDCDYLKTFAGLPSITVAH